MKRHLLCLSIGLSLVSVTAVAQDNTKPASPSTNCIPSVIKFEGFPCDSLYKIKGLENVTCDNYASITFEDMQRAMPIFNCMTSELNRKRKQTNGIK